MLLQRARHHTSRGIVDQTTLPTSLILPTILPKHHLSPYTSLPFRPLAPMPPITQSSRSILTTTLQHQHIPTTHHQSISSQPFPTSSITFQHNIIAQNSHFFQKRRQHTLTKKVSTNLISNQSSHPTVYSLTPDQPSSKSFTSHSSRRTFSKNFIYTSKRKVSYDPRKWESTYSPQDPLSGLPKDPFSRPLKKSTVQPGMDPGKDSRKRQFIQRLRWQLNEGVWASDALPQTRDHRDPLKPFIPQIPMMEDEPFRLQQPSPIWLAFEPNPKIKDFFGYYLPSRAKWKRTKNLMTEYTKGPLDVLHPRYKSFVHRYFSLKSLLAYSFIGTLSIFFFEQALLSKTELEEMFEITAKNYLRSESFLLTANTIQEMVNQGILDPNTSILEAKIFLEETLNVGYAYNAQVLKDFSYLIEGFSKSIEFRYPDEDNPNEVSHIDHFSQTDVDISYIQLERYLTSFERFFEIYYTRDIDMISLSTREPYNDKIASPRQIFWSKLKNIWIQSIYSPLSSIYYKFLSTFELLPYDAISSNEFTSNRLDLTFNPSGTASTRPIPQSFTHSDASNNFLSNATNISQQSFNIDPFSTSSSSKNTTHQPPTGMNSIEKRIWDAELHNIDFSQTATLQFNPNVGKLVDFYFDELPATFSYRDYIYKELLNPNFSLDVQEDAVQAVLRAQSGELLSEEDAQAHINLEKRLFQQKHLKYGSKTDYSVGFQNLHSPFANPLLSKEANISYSSDHKHRFLTESFLPTHLQAFKSAHMQSRSIRDVDQLLQESKMMFLRKNDPNSTENSPLAALYCQQANLIEASTNPNSQNDSSNQQENRFDQSYTQWAVNALYKSFWGSIEYVTSSTSIATKQTKQIANNMYRTTMDTMLPSAFHTLFTDPNLLEIQQYEEDLRNDQVDFQNQLNAIYKHQSGFKSVKGDGSTLNSIAPFSKASFAPQLSQKERQAIMEKGQKTFDAHGFGVCFSDLARQDYINMLLRNIDMLQNIRLLISKLAQRNHMDINDFNPAYGQIMPSLKEAPYLLAYYNQSLKDLAPLTHENPNLPLLPTLYQYNDIPNKGIRVLKERLKNDSDARINEYYRTQTLKDFMGLQRDLGGDVSDEMLRHFMFEPTSGKRRPLYHLDRVANRFEDDPEKVSDLQQLIGRVVTKLDMCLLQTFCELERQKIVFDVSLPSNIHVNTDLLTQDDRFMFDLQYQQEEYVRKMTISEMGFQVAGKTLDWSHLQQDSTSSPSDQIVNQ